LILVLQTTAFGAHGGIPTYNRVVWRALNELRGVANTEVLIVTDTPADVASCGVTSQVKLQTFSGRRFAFVMSVLRFALVSKIDLVLVGHVNYAPLGLMLKRLQPNLRYGVMVHGVDVWSRLPFLKRLALRRADFVTSVSDYSRRQAAEMNDVQLDRVRWLPNALEWCNASDAALSPNPAAAGIKLLSVCRLDARERYKGVDTVLRALPSLVSEFADLKYFVVGSGSDVERHKEIAKALGVAEHVSFLGAVSEETLRSHYQQCDIFLMPSSGEGFGIVFLEAMKYAKPVIAANSGAVSEVVADGLTGTLVEYGNVPQTAKAIADLARDAQKRNALGQAGYERLINNFTFEHFKTRFEELVSQEMSKQSLYLGRRSVLEIS